VHVYDESASLISRLCGIVSSSLVIGDSVLIVATAEHRDQLVKCLQDSGVDVRAHARDGRYTMVDAKEMLATFMLNGMPDRDLFEASVGLILEQARKAARNQAQGLTVFGEMVAVLWDEGKKEAALQLEALWNDALNDRAFHLHCAYPRDGFVNESDQLAVFNTHSHILQ
jgi:KaiC/GvpD/RAD55 family RecA-like ATPase